MAAQGEVCDLPPTGSQAVTRSAVERRHRESGAARGDESRLQVGPCAPSKISLLDITHAIEGAGPAFGCTERYRALTPVIGLPEGVDLDRTGFSRALDRPVVASGAHAGVTVAERSQLATAEAFQRYTVSSYVANLSALDLLLDNQTAVFDLK